MRTLVISSNRHLSPTPVMPLGACLVAEAAERAGHAVDLLDLMFERDPAQAITDRIRAVQPEIIGLSIRNIDNNDLRHPAAFHRDTAAVAEAIRRATAAPVIIGGAAVGVMPEELLRLTGAAWAAVGDGEVVLPALLDELEQGGSAQEVPGVAWLERGSLKRRVGSAVEPLMVCRAPDFRRWVNLRFYRSRLAAVPVQTKRGCPFRCLYCTYSSLEGQLYRLCPPISVAQTVRTLAAQGLRDIEFVDNVFNAPYEHAMGVCEALARVGSPARLQSVELNPLFLDDALLDAMEQAGFVGAGITVESVSDAVLDAMQKGFTAADVHHAAAAVRRHHLPCLWIFLFGGPGETMQSVCETLEFAHAQVRPGDTVFYNVGLRIYPGTGLERLARDEGVLDQPPEEMLEPAFYLSPALDRPWLEQTLAEFAAGHLNCLNVDSLALPYLSTLNWIGSEMGLRAPLWRHTRWLRRVLKLFHVSA